MAYIDKDSKTEITTGILMPQMSHLWRCTWLTSDKEITESISNQIISVDLNYIKKKLKMVIEQPLIGGALHMVIWDSCKAQRIEKINLYPRNGDSAFSPYVLRVNASITSHKYKLDYAKSGVVNHILKFKINNLFTQEIENNK